MGSQIKYPPCQVNRETEKPFKAHKWEIVSPEKITRQINGEAVTFYRIRCARCGINDPSPPTY